MLDGLVPVSGKHSITRVIATIFVPQTFLKPNDVFEKVKDLPNFSIYQKKDVIKPTTISIKNNSLQGFENSEVAGFIFEEYDDKGRLKNILKLENVRDNQSIITIENRVYSNWNDFKTRLSNDIKSLSDKIDIYIDAISLTYVDEFRWLNSADIDVKTIFNSDSEFLNNKFLDSKNGTLILISQGINEKNSIEEKTEITFNNDVKRIALSHQYAIKLEKLDLFTTLQEQGSFIDYYDKAHTANKQILFDVLSKESQKLINLS